ncbi:Chromo domain-containing protein 2 [Pleurostoma richardsiae]|uniref:Chromo domain-containing protein 2 n=1 Tax=Pleurostoma richardsiae TaxID=41990 RepID=A0AA38RZW2_9PEZI|nr:Chromo domain-containing protein 2 [Pleurostoma richardsiae]
MPPAISDDEVSEASGDAQVPATNGGRGRSKVSYTEPNPNEFDEDEDMGDGEVTVTNGDAEEEDDEEEGDEEEDVYVVEKILSHFIDENGEPRFQVKWEGYEKKSDRTWEPEDNLRENASVVLEEYYESIGGRDKLFETTKQALKSKKRGRPSTGADSGAKRPRKNGEHPRDSTPPASVKAVEWKVPSGSWENDVDNIEVALEATKTGKNEMVFYLTWKNGHKTQHLKDVVYKRCPQKMLRCYERHIKFKDEDDVEVKPHIPVKSDE